MWIKADLDQLWLGMAQSMVERVARHLASLDGHPPTVWKLYAGEARIAITAMKRPTVAMETAGFRAAPNVKLSDVTAIWRAMAIAASVENI